MVKETKTTPSSSAFENALRATFAAPTDNDTTLTTDDLVPALHFTHAVTAADKELGDGNWLERLFNKKSEASGELSITSPEGTASTIEWQRFTRGNDSLLMATDGERMFITMDDSKTADDWKDNAKGFSYNWGKFKDKVGSTLNDLTGGALDRFGFERSGAERHDLHAAYRHTVVNGGSDSLEAQSMAQMSEWLEEYPNLQVEISSFSRGSRAEYLADNMVAIIEQHNDDIGADAKLASITTLNAPAIGKGDWQREMDAMYIAHGTEVIHIEGVGDPVSGIKYNGEKTGIEYTFFDNMLIREPSLEMLGDIRRANALLGNYNGIVDGHTKTDDRILANQADIIVLDASQIAALETKLAALNPREGDFKENYASLRTDILKQSDTQFADIDTGDIELNTPVMHDAGEPSLDDDFVPPQASADLEQTQSVTRV